MYETYQDHPRQAKSHISLVLLMVFLVCVIGIGVFLIARPLRNALSKDDARARAGIVYDASAIEGGWDRSASERKGSRGHDQHQHEHRALF